MALIVVTGKDITPIINHDGTITAYRDGHFIGYIIDYENIGMI